MRGLTVGVSVGVIVSMGACGNDMPTDPDGPNGTGETCTAAPADESGEGTYYDATGAGNCSFDPTPSDLMVAAMNAPDYASAAWCGACVAVNGPRGSVTVRIVDQCPGCAKGALDLSPQAFAKLADLSAGRIPITWREVACDVSGPVAYHHKDATSQYYTAIQIRNHRYPIATLEAKDAGGAWHAVPRKDYNYFVPAAALGPGPYALRVTDTRGQTVEDDAVPLMPNTTVAGVAQFATCPWPG